LIVTMSQTYCVASDGALVAFTVTALALLVR